MNFCIITGRLARDPETRYTNSKKAVCSFTLGVDDGKDKDGNRKSLFIPCVAWEKTGELIDQYFVKGDPITVTGKIVPRTYEKDGQKRTATEVVVSGIEFPMAKPKREQAQGFEDVDDDTDLPF